MCSGLDMNEFVISIEQLQQELRLAEQRAEHIAQQLRQEQLQIVALRWKIEMRHGTAHKASEKIN